MNNKASPLPDNYFNMKIEYFLTTFSLFYCIIITNGDGICSMSLDGASLTISQGSLQTASICNAATGRPGKRGPLGPRGPKGEIGEPGPRGAVPTDVLESQNVKIKNLEDELKKVKILLEIYAKWTKGINGHYYYVSEAGMNWQQAKAFCEGEEARLATVGPRNPDMFELMYSLAPTDGYIWIGLNDLAVEGSWVWIDGVDSTSSNTAWYSGEPNNSGSGEDCAILDQVYRGGLIDRDCKWSAPKALCEIF